ncbi:hypothetical protein [Sphaerisporangium sp. TRM90804]|uniref:putative phage holin n=1 Tax=Sphaerisporangium sp. TRM90804 TaxID=3031113 RepID=UPI00244897A3|nr:hypothetical protein [Sphaerisporangium sp. TRM90804]MDH2424722.1 hypothetical protein [Sphaerisporangium sp. TRM90804]
MTEQLYAAGTVLVVLSALLADACVIAQMLLARWWQTPQGRHVAAFQSALGLCLTLWALRLIIPEGSWFAIARMASFALIPVVLAWRLVIIIRTWRDARRKRLESV